MRFSRDKNSSYSVSQLKYSKIVQTIELLGWRIKDRFPDSNLNTICNNLIEIAEASRRNIIWISKPLTWLRILATIIIITAVSGIIYGFTIFEFDFEKSTVHQIITLTESFINDIVLIGAAIFFLITLEIRVKRSKSLKVLNQLRALAHVVDMHQLTKDPSLKNDLQERTKHSPKRTLSKFELQRYLDYCSEILSLIGKISALYSQSLPDDVVVRTVNEIESLTTGLSQKIWQKLNIIGAELNKEQ